MNDKVRVGLISDLRGYGRRVPLALKYDEAMAEWLDLWRKDTGFRRYVAGTISPISLKARVPRRPKLAL